MARLFICLFFVITGCRVEVIPDSVPTTTTTTTTTTMPLREMPPLSWEKNHPERKIWSEYVYKMLGTTLWNTFDSADDVKRICPKYEDLSLEYRKHVIAEFWSQIALYESSWNPKSASVDVGSQSQKDTWSIGLFQISVVDQKNLGITLGYSYDDLLIPFHNIDLAFKIMERQIQKTHLYILPNTNKNRYWAVILDGNKYSQVSQILSKTNAIPGCK